MFLRLLICLNSAGSQIQQRFATYGGDINDLNHDAKTLVCRTNSSPSKQGHVLSKSARDDVTIESISRNNAAGCARACCIQLFKALRVNLQTRYRKHTLRSRLCSFTDFCISQCLSHFAALFIDPWDETFIVKSYHFSRSHTRMQGFLTQVRGFPAHRKVASNRIIVNCMPSKLTSQVKSAIIENRANDPSAGSPTETLLRLLLPLSDKVH